MTPREHFESLGKLKQTANKSHCFCIGRIMSQFTWANSNCWSSLCDSGLLTDNWLKVGIVHNVAGKKIFSLSLWKLSILIGLTE